MLRAALLALVCMLFQGMAVCAQELPPAPPDTRFFQAQKLEKEKNLPKPFISISNFPVLNLSQ
ncbi:MAG: hypothetical protein HY774_07800 [Acidobacteria bacterium]|nr:hypothetical protein [Acidobacteriota bacterium]